MSALTTTHYRVDALPFETELEAQAAILIHKDPDVARCTVRHYAEGYYVLVQFGNGGTCWLTKRKVA